MILKSFEFPCDFDFQITTSKMIWILNHLYLTDLISILKSSTYDDFAHLCIILCLSNEHGTIVSLFIISGLRHSNMIPLM